MRAFGMWTVLFIFLVGCASKPAVLTKSIAEPEQVAETQNAKGADKAITKKAPKKESPECEPPDKSKDPYADLNNNMSINGWPYRCSKEGKWVEDTATIEAMAKEEKSREDLVWAMRTRLLTTEEMERVQSSGVYILMPSTPGMFSWDRVENEKVFNDLLAQQFKFRLLAEKNTKNAE